MVDWPLLVRGPATASCARLCWNQLCHSPDRGHHACGNPSAVCSRGEHSVQIAVDYEHLLRQHGRRHNDCSAKPDCRSPTQADQARAVCSRLEVVAAPGEGCFAVHLLSYGWEAELIVAMGKSDAEDRYSRQKLAPDHSWQSFTPCRFHILEAIAHCSFDDNCHGCPRRRDETIETCQPARVNSIS